MTETSLSAALDYRPRSNSRLGQALRREGVKETAEFLRIASIPTRSLRGSIDVEGLSAMLRVADDDPLRCRGNCGSRLCDNGRLTLFPDQAYALKELVDVGGAFVGTDVGSGKSLMIILGAIVTQAKRPLAIMPAAARKGFESEMIPFMRMHFRIPRNLMIGSYEGLSTTNGKDFLTSRMPDWVFADEAQWLKNEDAARGARFARFLDDFPDTHLGAFSGSFFDRGVDAFAHLLYFCLRHAPHGVPLPYRRQNGRNVMQDELATWANAIDADTEEADRYGGGALLRFAELLTPQEREACRTDLELAQRSFGVRLISTPGVVFSSLPTSTLPIHIRELPIDVPETVREAFEVLRSTWETPRGDTIADAPQLYTCVRQLAQGFFYRWVWPIGPSGKEEPDLIWLDARRNWHRFVRRAISYGRGKFDTKAEVEHACERFEQWTLAKAYKQRDVIERLSALTKLDSQEYRNWQITKDRYTPVTETVWIDKFLVRRVAEWLDVAPGIAWVESRAMGDAIRAAGFRYYRGGEDEIIYETVSCAAAIKAHAIAKNLQHFNRNLVVTPPTKGALWEQLIGRTDRTGQRADRIVVDLFLHVREFWSAFYRARQDASFAQAPGAAQKLCRAEIDLATTEDAFVLKTFSDDPLWRYNASA